MTDLERGPSSEGAPSMHASSLNNSPQSYYTGDKLEPCPFCGGDNAYHTDVSEQWHQIICGSCGCRSNEFPGADGPDKAARSWNTRSAATIISNLQSERDALKHDIERHLGIIAELEKERNALSADLEKVQTELDEENIRAIAAESSLSRIKSETVERESILNALQYGLEAVRESFDYAADRDDSYLAQARYSAIEDAIRSLSTDDSGATGGAG